MTGLLIPMIMPLMSAAADSSVQVFAVPLTSDIASLLSPLRLAKTSEPPPRLRDFHSLASSFKRTIFIIQGTPSGLAKNWLTVRSINFCVAIQLWFSSRHYKFGGSNNNKLLSINLISVRADGNANTSSSPSPDVVQHCNRPITL